MSEPEAVVIPVAVIPTVVAACLYTEMRLTHGYRRDGNLAFDNWTAVFVTTPETPEEEPAARQARADLAALGREAFVRHWAELMTLLDQMGATLLYTTLHGVFGPTVEAGFAQRRTRQAGQA